MRSRISVFIALLLAATTLVLVAPAPREAEAQTPPPACQPPQPAGHPNPVPSGVAPPVAGATWDGCWSSWTFHSVPWQCIVRTTTGQDTIAYIFDPNVPTIYLRVAEWVSCGSQTVTGGVTQILPRAPGYTARYTACKVFGGPGLSGCGHTTSQVQNISTGLGPPPGSPPTSYPGAKEWVEANSVARWRYMGHSSVRHQTWRYTYCPQAGTDRNVSPTSLVRDAATRHIAPGGHRSPWYGNPNGITSIPQLYEMAARSDDEPRIEFGSVNAGDLVCWKTDTLTVEIGPDISVDEGDPAVLDVTLTRASATGSSPCVEVRWRTDNGSAHSGADFAGTTGMTHTFTAGAIPGAGSLTQQLAPISTVADSVTEGDEQFKVKIISVSLCPGATGPDPTVIRPQALVKILDTPANRQVSISPTLVTVTEGNPGDNVVVPFTIFHDGNPGDVTSVRWKRINRSAHRSTTTTSNDNDYVRLPYSSVALTFPPGATSLIANIEIVEDTVCEPTQTLEVTIFDPLPAATTSVTAVDTATVTIEDDDCTKPILSVGPDIAVTEGTGGPATVAMVAVSHTGSAGDVNSVLYHVVAETATLGTDFTGAGPSGARADIPATATSTSISIDIDPDSLCEDDETFIVKISNPRLPGSATIDVDEARVCIVDDDCLPTLVNIKVDPDTVQVNEPDPFATLTITHDGSPGDVQSVRYRLFDASATAGTDYTTVPSSGIIVNFAGATSVDVDVPIIDDAVCEGTETFTMVVDNPVAMPGVTATVSSPAGRVRILDNEDCVPVILSACDEAQPAGVHSEGTPIGTHPSRGSCPVPYSWSTWPGARTAGRGSPPPRGACVGASAGHDAWNVIAGQTNTLDIFANDRLGGATPSILISPQEGRVRLSGAGAEYVSSAWAHGSDEFVYQLRYGTGSNDFCNARVQITVLDTGPVTLGTGVVFLFPEQGGFEAANWKPSVRTYNDDGADINPHQVQTTHQLWAETQWTCRRRSSVNAGDPDYKGHTIPTGTPHYGGETQFSGPFSRTYHSGNGTTSTSSFTWQETLTGSYDHSHDPLDHHGEGPHGNGIDDHDHSYSYNVTRYSSAVTVSAVQNAPTSRPAAYSDSTTSLTGPYPCPTVAHNGSSVGGSASSTGGCK